MPAPVTVDLSASLGYAGDPPVKVGMAAVPARKLKMTVSGALSGDGSTALNFPDLLGDPTETEILAWKDAGSLGGAPDYAIYGSPGNWSLFYGLVGVVFVSTDDVATPDLATSWTPQGSATGNPAVAGSPVAPVTVNI